MFWTPGCPEFSGMYRTACERLSCIGTGKQLRRSTSPTTSVRYLDGSTCHSWWDMDLQCPSKSTTSIRRQRLSKKCPVLITPFAIHLPVELSPSNGCSLDDIEGGTLQWQLQLQWSGERVDGVDILHVHQRYPFGILQLKALILEVFPRNLQVHFTDRWCNSWFHFRT